MRGLPALRGEEIRLEWAVEMRAHRGRLWTGAGAGMEVHAASFLRERRMVLDRCLLKQKGELRRIVCHELMHFVWMRLGNGARRAWEGVLAAEWKARARGELGWSAEWRKAGLGERDVAGRSRKWREYACESFCATGAGLFAGGGEHEEYTLGARFRKRRGGWMEELVGHQRGGLRI
ncbi:MAG: hypothetical protein HY821_00460 [Acidobacteria bacterium]|nr:hypothetical protein [Acidobacteriota bacterium]